MAAGYEEQDKVDGWFLKLKLNPWVEWFIWRICRNAIPTNDYLLAESNLCPRGCLEVGDVDHCTATCPRLMQVILLLNAWGFSVPTFYSFSDILKKLKAISVRNSFLAKMYLVLIFHSWNNRNRVKHGVGVDSDIVTASKVLSVMATLHSDKVIWANWGTNQPIRLSYFWHPLLPYDGSLQKSYKAGAGGVVRDCRGRFLLAFGCGSVHWDCAQVELLAFKTLKNFVQNWMLEAEGIIIEGDNLNVINFLHNLYSKPGKVMNDRIEEDLLFLRRFDKVLFNFVNRQCNKLANYCANLACEIDFLWDVISDNNIPPSFIWLLKEECDRLPFGINSYDSGPSELSASAAKWHHDMKHQTKKIMRNMNQLGIVAQALLAKASLVTFIATPTAALAIKQGIDAIAAAANLSPATMTATPSTVVCVRINVNASSPTTIRSWATCDPTYARKLVASYRASRVIAFYSFRFVRGSQLVISSVHPDGFSSSRKSLDLYKSANGVPLVIRDVSNFPNPLKMVSYVGKGKNVMENDLDVSYKSSPISNKVQFNSFNQMAHLDKVASLSV
ncbi:hypothetical protein M5K25_027631 [Dendrobium thyrsiflorum]|uniref:RNase H type-1 domain-containing protein n=1 Tax=Dendrobium thyrsiflorum TaxID=117978 RepID=A0ABD0TUC8_DENTH